MSDRIFEAFLERQCEEGMALAQASDLLDLIPLGGTPPRRYRAAFRCKGLVRNDGAVEEASHFEAGIWFTDSYLRHVEPNKVVCWLGPRNVFHPNISDRAPVICLGHMAPATPLVDLIYQIFEIITYNNVTMDERDALNHEACRWARHHQARLPIDRRPLKRRTLKLNIVHKQADEQ